MTPNDQLDHYFAVIHAEVITIERKVFATSEWWIFEGYIHSASELSTEHKRAMALADTLGANVASWSAHNMISQSSLQHYAGHRKTLEARLHQLNHDIQARQPSAVAELGVVRPFN
jgi:hypothetical protein